MTAVGGGYYYPNFSNEEPETQRADSLDEQARAALELTVGRVGQEGALGGRRGGGGRGVGSCG